MGAESSTLAEIDDNKLLVELTGNKKIERDADEFWDALLQFVFELPEDREGSRILDSSIEKLCKKIATNNHLTGNFTCLVGVFIFHVQNLIINPKKQESFEDCQKPSNALLIVRCICKYLIDKLPEQELIRQFNTLPSCEGTRTVFEEFLLTLSCIICKLNVTNETYHLHLESVNTLIILLSVQMQELRPTTSSAIHLSIMNSKCSESAVQIVEKLFQNFIKNDLLPSEDEGSGFISRTLSSVWSMFGVGPEVDLEVLRPLASHSLLLLLILPNQLTKDKNPYRDAIFNCKGHRSTAKVHKNPKDKGQHNSNQEGDSQTGSLVLNFNSLFRAICRGLPNDHTVLLLYLLIHRNEAFMSHILKRDDVGNMVFPLLEILYEAESRNSHLTYMTLIVLLILSQEEELNARMHHTMLPDVPWYKDRALHDISLGGVICLVLIRMIQQNIFKIRDKYLHTNCLATLANMSSHFRNLDPYVCDRFVRVLSQLLKKYSKVTKNVKNYIEESSEEFSDSNVLEEIIRMFLEVLNSCIVTKLLDNPNLVYALLHERETIEQLQTHSKFQDVTYNFNVVLNFFNSRLESQNMDTFSVEAVHDVIHRELQQMPCDRFKKFPELRFKYVEEEQPEDFFVPYVWSLVYKASYLHWNLENIALFKLSISKDG